MADEADQLDETLPPPGQDSNLWGGHFFVDANLPVDWCTARQAEEQAGRTPDSVLFDIASGKIESSLYSQKEAREMIEAMIRRSRIEG